MGDSFKIFILEDDLWYAELLEHYLAMNPDYIIEKFTTANECIKMLYQKPNVLCVDYSLPDMKGDQLIKKLANSHGHIPVILISGQQDIQTAIDLLKHDNVQDYIVKDDDTNERLWKSIIKIRERGNLVEEVEQLREELGKKYEFENIIKGKSPGIRQVFNIMQKACSNNITVSVSGETGTGKELVAKCIHYNSPRSKKPFVAVNRSAIPSELVESELFGHEKGAFTGAQARRIGRFEEANKGTIFLDEVADMDVAMQAKLLRVLQEKEVTRVGSNNTVSVDVRVIVATHKNLAEEVKQGNFREDLYFRLLGLPVKLPPLRDRKEDILVLAQHFLENFAKENKTKKKTLGKEAREKLLAYAFPGNVRELKAVIELAAVMVDENDIKVEDITFHSTISIKDLTHVENTLKEYNGMIIRHFLEKYNDDIALVAQKLDIGKSTLYKMIKRGDV